MCLTNKAVYIARDRSKVWHATGTQFAVPYVFKTLFSHEPIEFSDLCETKTVASGAIYLDMNEQLRPDEHNYIFVGRAGLFCPIKRGCGGGELVRLLNDKYYAVVGTKDYRWLESEAVQVLEKQEDVDISYYDRLADEAVKSIEQYVSFEELVKE